jgi:hypothetical protein
MPQVPDVQMTWPISHIAAVTPADATDLPGGDSRLIWVTRDSHPGLRRRAAVPLRRLPREGHRHDRDRHLGGLVK